MATELAAFSKKKAIMKGVLMAACFKGGGMKCVRSAVASPVNVGERSSTEYAKAVVSLMITALAKRSEQARRKEFTILHLLNRFAITP